MAKIQFVRISPQGPILECFERPGAAAFLFYPGASTEPGHYRLFLSRLYLAGFSVCGLHLAGHGRNKNKIQTFERMLDEGLEAQEWIIKNKTPSLAVGGHSQGGICAIAHGAASSLPGAIFAFNACLPQSPSAIEATRFRRLRSRREEIMRAIKWIARIFPNLPVPLPIYLSGRKLIARSRRPIVTGKGRGRISYPAAFLYSLFASRIPESIKCPLWLIGACGDALFTEKLMEETYGVLSAPVKRLVYLPDGGHLALLNPWLAKFAAALCACAALSLGLPLNADNAGIFNPGG